MKREMITLDGNEAAAYVAYQLSEVVAIYPITPSSAMAESCDGWSAEGKKNAYGTVPLVVEMQSEGGAAGTLHGALQAGALTTTFTASQGLLLMIPNMYKIAGELTPTVFHVSARSLAAQGLSIFGDHSDVMSTRQTGFAMLCSGSVQEVMDLALISHASTLETRIPFLHFFDGFRTSHEVMKVEQLTVEDLHSMIPEEKILEHRKRALNPERPLLRGTAQNPDVYFQGRETVNPFYKETPQIVQSMMDKFAKLTGRQYKLFDYFGHPEAERVIVLMGSGSETVEETVTHLIEKGEKIGFVKVRLFRPFDSAAMLDSLPKSVKKLAVLDRCKEPGSSGEPLYQDVITAWTEAIMDGKKSAAEMPRIVGGRYGLSSKEFTPAMIKGIFDELTKDTPKNHFTIGINDDVSHSSLDYDPSFSTEPDSVFRGMFFGLGADGTVSANKNSIKIIGEETENYAQGYFVYDSKKSGSMTTSHLRFGKTPIQSTYLITRANFVACHQFSFLERVDILRNAVEGATFLLNAPYSEKEVWDKLPREVQADIINKKLKFYTIDAVKVALETGMGGRINTIMQTCFFYISGILPEDEAISRIKESIRYSFGKKGEELVQMNFKAVDQSIANLHKIDYPSEVTAKEGRTPMVSEKAPDYVRNVMAKIMAGDGDKLPVSAMPVDGTFPTATTRWEKRNISLSIPVWDPQWCTQCGKCSFVCPHAVIRIKAYAPDQAKGAPETFKNIAAKGADFDEGTLYTIQVAPEDCTGCELCVEVCPAKNKEQAGLKAINMAPQIPIRETERANWEFFENIPEYDRSKLNLGTVKGTQFLDPLFEFSGACSGCGETPYIKLVTQLYGDRLMIANSTGCSSIYGGNLPSTPYTVNTTGQGPTWANSLFEDTAEFGLGFRLAVDKKVEQCKELVAKLAGQIGDNLVTALLGADQSTDAGVREQRARVAELRDKLSSVNSADARHLDSLADYFIRKSVWAIGGDGWAYDIGFGGLDHVFASGRDINLLVMDTEVYSNTGGQMSKATPMGAVAKFAAAGNPSHKKDLGLMAISYGNVYVARIAMGATDIQTVKAIQEAESYPGVSLIIAYSHCIAHGYDMKHGLSQQKLAVDSGYWPLYRYDPRNLGTEQNPFKLESKPPKIPLEDFLYNETRFKMLKAMNPEAAKGFLEESQKHANELYNFYAGFARIYEPKKEG